MGTSARFIWPARGLFGGRRKPRPEPRKKNNPKPENTFGRRFDEGSKRDPVSKYVRRWMTLNPVGIFLSFLFWGWLWGVPGMLLAVPILATVKIFCDRVDSLTQLGEFLGD
jgi:AI-2E family transporter